MDFVKNLAGGNKDEQTTSSSGEQKSSGGFMDKINNAAGGGAAGEKKEDGLDKGTRSNLLLLLTLLNPQNLSLPLISLSLDTVLNKNTDWLIRR